MIHFGGTRLLKQHVKEKLFNKIRVKYCSSAIASQCSKDAFKQEYNSTDCIIE